MNDKVKQWIHVQRKMTTNDEGDNDDDDEELKTTIEMMTTMTVVNDLHQALLKSV